MFISVLKMLTPLIIAFSIGIIFRKRQIIDLKGCYAVKSIISRVLLPVTLFDGMLFSKYSKETLIMIVVSMIAMAFSFALAWICKGALPSRKTYFPFAVSTWAGGTLGIPLCATIYGQKGISTMALLDFGHTLIVHLIIIPILRQIEESKSGLKNTLKTLFTSECFDAVILGAICGLCGLGDVLLKSQIMTIYNSTFSAITGSTTFLIMFTIGYGFDLKKELVKDISVTALFRIIIMSLAFCVAHFLLGLFINIDRQLLGILIIAYSLPTSFGLFVLGKFTNNQDYLSTMMSSYTILTLISFVLVTIFLV